MRRMTFKIIAGKSLLLAASLALLFSASIACNNNPKPATTGKPGASGSGVLNLYDSAPITLDPAAAADLGSATYIVQMFSGLLKLDAKMNPVADIASTWDTSPDGKTYTFHLRKDVRFHDGKQVKAADFKYSWERALSPATGSLTASTYLVDIVGASEMLSGGAASLSGVKVVDDFTLQVTIDSPKAYFLDKMSYPTAYVVDQANVASGAQWWLKPNGTGPFKLKQWVKDQLLVMQRNDIYYGDKAKLAEVDFKLLAGNPLQLYQSAEIDVSPLGAAYMGWATDPGNQVSGEVQVYPELSFSYLGFNTTIPPFDDAKVRQAFTYAVDKEKVATLSAQNVVATAYGILPPGMPGYNASLAGLRFDPVKAKQLIAQSKYGDVSRLPPIVLTTSGYGGDVGPVLGGVIEEWRRNLGVEVTVRQLEPQNYLYSLNQEKDNLYDSGWIADYPDPQDFLDLLFHTGAQNNTGGYSNPQLDALLDKAAVDQNPVTRLQAYQQAESIIVQDAATLPLFFGKSYVLVKPWVTGYSISPLGIPLLSQVSVGLKPPTGGTAR